MPSAFFNISYLAGKYVIWFAIFESKLRNILNGTKIQDYIIYNLPIVENLKIANELSFQFRKTPFGITL